MLLVPDSHQVSREVKSVKVAADRPASRLSPMEASGKGLAYLRMPLFSCLSNGAAVDSTTWIHLGVK